MTDDDPRHGTAAGYVAHSYAKQTACAPCRAAATRYNKARRLARLRGEPTRLVSAVGTRRRVQALARIGWSLEMQAARLGISQQALSQSTGPNRAQISRQRHDAVAALYAELSTINGPAASGAARAATKGWPAPAAWTDPDDPAERPFGVSGVVRVRMPGTRTPKQRRDAHAAYVRGDREPETIAGEREYQRMRPDRIRRAA